MQCHRVFNLFDALKIVSSLAAQREGFSVSGTKNILLDYLLNLCMLYICSLGCFSQDVVKNDLKLIVVDSVYDIAAPILGDREAEGEMDTACQ